MACRLVAQNGVGYALEVIRDIHAEYPNAHLVIAGDGVLMHERKHVAAEYKISDNVHFLGGRSKVKRWQKIYPSHVICDSVESHRPTAKAPTT